MAVTFARRRRENARAVPITAGTSPADIVITPDGKTAYVTSAVSDTVTRSGPPPIRPFRRSGPGASQPMAIAITPDGIAITKQAARDAAHRAPLASAALSDGPRWGVRGQQVPEGSGGDRGP